MPSWILVSALAFSLVPEGRAAEPLPATSVIRREVDDSGPLESVASDSVTGDWRRPTRPTSSAPGIQRTLVQDVPLSVRDTGKPGELSQFRGMGISAEDTNVQVFGVPLNYAQGGGFDFAIFPAYLWSDVSFRLGGNPLSLDPRGVSGTLTLTPWTARALARQTARTELGAMYSGLHVGQGWGAWASGNAAIAAGYSAGALRGPSGAFSWRLLGAPADRESWRLTAHLLATAVEGDVEGSLSFPTPLAKQSSRRVIPFVELARGDLALAAFADFTRIQYDNPDPVSPFRTDDRAEQLGIQSAYKARDNHGHWSLAWGERAVRYRTQDFSPPEEWITNLSAGRHHYLGSERLWTLEAVIALLHVTRFGAHPQPSLGIRRELLDGELALFVKGSLSHRTPSMADRYYNVIGYAGNPALQMERDWSANFGADLRRGGHAARLEFIAQHRDQAQVQVTDSATFTTSKQNVEFANVYLIQAQDEWRLVPSLRLRHAVAYTASSVAQSSFALPYQPALTTTQSVGWLPLGDGLELGARVRAATPAVYDPASGSEIPGYALADLFAEAAWSSGLRVGLSVENLMDRPVQLVRDYPQRRAVAGTLRLEL